MQAEPFSAIKWNDGGSDDGAEGPTSADLCPLRVRRVRRR